MQNSFSERTIIATMETCLMTTLLIPSPCYYGALFWPAQSSVSCLKNPFNTASRAVNTV